ncbi:MAG: DUF1343 domain-containing protein [Candidatus Marinimicrobia bacterium]|jgi:uncharacterized protein YbbC (DUF1343 family)|nr:DUF1343 domain-containing protein [Candidatus Neomarinimicrobiota bacterium]MDX9777383.1 DUF1343 domain-containing protein [bacterium]
MKKRNIIPVFLFLAFLSTACTAEKEPAVKLGIDVLEENGFDILKGKRVGLITNPTGVNRHLKSTVDILFEAPEVELVALFGPEHGVRGNYAAGDKVENAIDPVTGVPAFSLYGKTNRPTKESLENVDVLVFDIQDIGCRSYTYISTMGYCMEAAAEYGKKFVVLDRPNPLTGNIVEGATVKDGFYSGVSAYKIPYVHGLTIGELARVYNEEGLLKNSVKCDLTVVPMKGWKRKMAFEDTGLHWVPSSPHIPEGNTPPYYVATGILGELYTMNIGIGYTTPFKTYAAEWMKAQEVTDAMNALGLEGVIFRPVAYKPFYGVDQGKEVQGVQVHITDFRKVELMYLQFHFMEVHHKLYPEVDLFKMNEKRWRMFDMVCGTDEIRTKFMENYRFADIKPLFEHDVQQFREMSQKYHLYK